MDCLLFVLGVIQVCQVLTYSHTGESSTLPGFMSLVFLSSVLQTCEHPRQRVLTL
jgi:hypothetical protein